jgi:hypothetical protein
VPKKGDGERTHFETPAAIDAELRVERELRSALPLKPQGEPRSVDPLRSTPRFRRWRRAGEDERLEARQGAD